MTPKSTQIGLSANDLSELMQLRDSYQSKIAYKVSDSAAALGVSLDVLAGELPGRVARRGETRQESKGSVPDSPAPPRAPPRREPLGLKVMATLFCAPS